MSEPFARFLDELGEELFGVQWTFYRPALMRWVDANPERKPEETELVGSMV